MESNNILVLGKEEPAKTDEELIREVEEARENSVIEGKREEVFVFCLFAWTTGLNAAEKPSTMRNWKTEFWIWQFQGNDGDRKQNAMGYECEKMKASSIDYSNKNVVVKRRILVLGIL